MVIAGAIRATDALEARSDLRNGTRGNSHSAREGGGEIKILGRIRFEGTGKGKGKVSSSTFDSDEDSSLSLDLILPSSGIPFCSSSTKITPIIIMYKPPNANKLQFLSLQPLQLDLNSFISPTSRSHLFSESQGDTNEEGKEERMLSEKMRKINEIDFTAVRGGGNGMGGIELGKCIDWVSYGRELVKTYDADRMMSGALPDGRF